MNNTNKYLDYIRDYIKDSDETFIIRHNKNKDNNKMNFGTTLYASLMNLNKSSVSKVRNHMDIDKNININVSKNAIIKTRNNEKTYKHIDALTQIMMLFSSFMIL
jgi:hypothetical protein